MRFAIFGSAQTLRGGLDVRDDAAPLHPRRDAGAGSVALACRMISPEEPGSWTQERILQHCITSEHVAHQES
jgi:hypothetical protein